jgi:lauroyl/myristoyl acyltransferase
VRIYERLIRAHPQQWLMIEDVWPVAAPVSAQEIVPQAVGLRRR